MTSFMERHPWWRFCATATRISLFSLVLVTAASSDCHAAGTDFVNRLILYFQVQASYYMDKMLEATKVLFYWSAILELCYLGIKKVLTGEPMYELLKELMLMFFCVAFFYALITHFEPFAQQMIESAPKIVGVNADDVMTDEPFKAGVKLCEKIYESCKWNSVKEVFISITLCIISVGVILCFLLISLQILLIKCECAIGIAVSALFIGLGACEFFRNFAKNAIKFVFATCVKFLALEVVVKIGLSFVREFAEAKGADNFQYSLVAIVFSIILWQICVNIPDLVSEILSGSYGSGGRGFSPTRGNVAPATATAKALATKGKG